MENPATWSEAERVVNRTIAEHVPGPGLSLTRRITDALRERGLLANEVDAGLLIDKEVERLRTVVRSLRRDLVEAHDKIAALRNLLDQYGA